MATPIATPKLQDLARRIAEQEAALAGLRRKLDERLTDLNHRRENLRAELRTVEAEIEAVAQGSPPGDRAVPDPTPPRAADTSNSKNGTPARRRAGSPSLSEFLVRLVREHSGQPLSMKELQEQTIQRGFPSRSGNLPRMVKKRAYELVERGLLGRDRHTGGFGLPQTRSGSKPASQATGASARAASKPGVASQPHAAKFAPQTRRPTGAAGRAGRKQPSLRSLLLELLRKTGRTLSAQELTEAAKKAGYRSQSRDFKNVVWVALGNMPEAERDPRGGYRLKKGAR